MHTDKRSIPGMKICGTIFISSTELMEEKSHGDWNEAFHAGSKCSTLEWNSIDPSLEEDAKHGQAQ